MSLNNANISDILCDQKSPVHREAGFLDVDRLQTDIATYSLKRPSGPIQWNVAYVQGGQNGVKEHHIKPHYLLWSPLKR